MCHFITAILSSDAKEALVKRLAKTYGLNWRPIENPTIIEQLEKGEIQYLTTRGQCDCGTALGTAIRNSDKRESETSYWNEIHEFRKKGWSDNKIQRWLGEKEKVKKRKARIEEEMVKSDTEIERWMLFIEKIFENEAAGSVGVLIHNYSGDIESERIKIKMRKSQSINKVKKEYFMKMEEDTIYDFHN